MINKINDFLLEYKVNNKLINSRIDSILSLTEFEEEKLFSIIILYYKIINKDKVKRNLWIILFSPYIEEKHKSLFEINQIKIDNLQVSKKDGSKDISNTIKLIKNRSLWAVSGWNNNFNSMEVTKYSYLRSKYY